jgi:hypothetical protein
MAGSVAGHGECVDSIQSKIASTPAGFAGRVGSRIENRPRSAAFELARPLLCIWP